MSKILNRMIGALAALGAASSLAWSAPASATRGKVIAQRWCAECHVVTPDQRRAKADVPTFREIAKRRQASSVPLEQFLMNPHPVMPDMQLTRAEVADLAAYIRSQK